MATTRRAAPAIDVDVTPPPPRGADPDAWRMMVANSGGVEMPTPEETAEEDAAQRVRALLGGNAGDGVRVSIYRRTPFRKTLEWCADYSPDQFMEGGLPLIHADLGAGAYEWRAIGRTGSLGRGHFEIAANARAANPTNPTQPAAVPVPDALTRALETIAQGQAAILQTLAAKPDPMADMEKQLRLMSMMREAMGGNAAPAPAVAAAPAPTLLEQLQTLKALRDFAKDEAGPSSEPDPDNPLSFLMPVLDVVKEGFRARQAPQHDPLPPIQAPPSLQGLPAPTPTPAPSSEPAAGNDSPDGLAWRGIIAEALRMAKAGESSEAGGRLLFQTLPDEFLPYLRLPNCAEILGSMAPELVPHSAWVEGARVEALRLLDADEAA